MKEKTTFASRVQMLRKEKKLTQTQLGELLGIKGRTIRSYESDERRPDFDGLLQMARFLAFRWIIWSGGRKKETFLVDKGFLRKSGD